MILKNGSLAPGKSLKADRSKVIKFLGCPGWIVELVIFSSYIKLTLSLWTYRPMQCSGGSFYGLYIGTQTELEGLPWPLISRVLQRQQMAEYGQRTLKNPVHTHKVSLGVMCSPRDPRFMCSNPAEVDGFFSGPENPEDKSSRRDFKPGVSSLRFQAC